MGQNQINNAGGMGGAPFPQGNFFYPPSGQQQINIGSGIRKRPTTANRSNNNKFGEVGGKKVFSSKNPSSLDLEVSRMRPRHINQEREKLYDDAMKQKITANFFKEENVRLKTKLHIYEGELTKKERLIDDLLMQ